MRTTRRRPSMCAAGLAALCAGLAASPRAEAGAWTLPAGKTWVRAGFFFQSTDERYFLDGRRIPYFFEGHNRTVAAFFDLNRGLTDRLELDVQIPFYGITFNDLADRRSTTGVGDIRVGARYNITRGGLVTTVGATVKLPTGEFVNDAEVVPVGEGQYDIEIAGELGRSLWPRPAYLTALVGYRIRTANGETGIDFGDEIFWRGEGGYTLGGRVLLKLVVHGLRGFDSTSFGLLLPSLRREILYLEPGGAVFFTPDRGIELSIPVSLRGRNWPAGPVLSVGFFQRW